MKNNINGILIKVLEKIIPKEAELKEYNFLIKQFSAKLEKGLKELKINAEIFIGGSFAKKTLIQKNGYDADLFLRFNEKYSGEAFSSIMEKIMEGVKNKLLIHGSRDYYRVELKPGFFIEIIPVKKISRPEKAENTTDLSYFHVRYINNKIKTKKILDEIRLAKAFCYANKCYGAESYIQGFSGYALELLVYHYGGFMKFIKEIIKIKDRTVIDIEKKYKTKNQVLTDMNGSKLNSPIILIDPTYKQRNALAALSKETFERFQKACRKFIANPSVELFETQKTDLEKIRKEAKAKKLEFILLEIKTNKQEGDIAGSKLLKFYRHLSAETEKFFEVKHLGFNYNGKKTARCYFAAKTKKEILISGPNMKDRKNVRAFEKIHKNYFTRKGRIYSKEKIDFSIKEFINKWKKKNKHKLKEMSITDLEVIND